jgi:hypothetical protein
MDSIILFIVSDLIFIVCVSVIKTGEEITGLPVVKCLTAKIRLHFSAAFEILLRRSNDKLFQHYYRNVYLVLSVSVRRRAGSHYPSIV